MYKLTRRQRTVLEIIHAHCERNGRPPTIREIAEDLGVASPNGVNDHLKALESKGVLRREATKSRALLITPAGLRELGVSDETDSPPEDTMLQVRLLGRIAAGVPVESIVSDAPTLRIDPALFVGQVGGGLFALRVQGESMTGDGILEGDTIFVQPSATVARDAVVAVQIDGESTVKRLRQETDALVLLSSNPAYPPIRVANDGSRDVSVLGVVIGVFRTLSAQKAGRRGSGR
jgi:repressor LexA